MNNIEGLQPLLEASDISKVFPRPSGPLTVLNDVDFVLQKKQAIAVMGASGSGKSTLLNILGSLDHPNTGSFRFKGEALNFQNPQVVNHWRSHCIGFVFQNRFQRHGKPSDARSPTWPHNRGNKTTCQSFHGCHWPK